MTNGTSIISHFYKTQHLSQSPLIKPKGLYICIYNRWSIIGSKMFSIVILFVIILHCGISTHFILSILQRIFLTGCIYSWFSCQSWALNMTVTVDQIKLHVDWHVFGIVQTEQILQPKISSSFFFILPADTAYVEVYQQQEIHIKLLKNFTSKRKKY